MQDLSQLRDIKLPEAISQWPMAYGWWLSLLVIIVLISAGLYFSIQYRKKNRAKRQAIKVLEEYFDNFKQHQDSLVFLQQCNELLKRFCRHKYPVALSLSGSAWGDFLQQHSPINTFTEQQIVALTQGLYQAQHSYDSHELFHACRLWLKNNNEVTS